MEDPRIHLQLELTAVRESFLQRFNLYQEELQVKVNEAVVTAFDDFDVEQSVRSLVTDSLQDIIEDAIDREMRFTAQQLISRRIAEELGEDYGTH